MATDDQQVLVTGQASAPATFKIPGNGQIRPKAVFATFDGTSAAGAFLPALKVISDAGETVGIYPTSSAVAAGASADVSWFPRVGGGGSGTTATPTASAYLNSFTPHTFTGTVGFSATWNNFQTTDTSVFGTNPFNTFSTPPNNQAGDVNLMLLKDGAYAVSASAVWAHGTVNFFGQVQMGHVDYQTDGRPTAIAALASTTPPFTNEGDQMTYDMQLFTLPQTWSPASLYLLLEGQTATNYTVDQWSLVCHWFGSGIGPDTQVY